MNRMRSTVIILGFALLVSLPGAVLAQLPDFDKTFFDDYSHLTPLQDRLGGTDMRYVTSGALQKLAKYNAVMVDEPSAGKYFGGDVAAPVFSTTVQQTLRMMGVQPDMNVKPQIVVNAVEESF